jgi:hypothetical protein
MKEYSKRERLPFTILNVAEITREKAERLWDALSATTSKVGEIDCQENLP